MTTEGLRERKKRKTKASIQREALRLFKKRGYDETTIEDIAAAAEISPSTFFNYFPSKEDVVIYDEYDPEVFAALTTGRDEPLSQSIRKLAVNIGQLMAADREVIYERARLTLEVPELRARILEELERASDLFAAVIAERTGLDAQDFDVHVISITMAAVAFEAAVKWVREGGKGNLIDPLMRGMEVVRIFDLVDGLERRGKAEPASSRQKS